jgi:hypothetical protein
MFAITAGKFSLHRFDCILYLILILEGYLPFPLLPQMPPVQRDLALLTGINFVDTLLDG